MAGISTPLINCGFHKCNDNLELEQQQSVGLLACHQELAQGCMSIVHLHATLGLDLSTTCGWHVIQMQPYIRWCSRSASPLPLSGVLLCRGLTIACSILLSMATTLAPEALQERDKQTVSEQLRALGKYKCATQSGKYGDTGVISVSETKRERKWPASPPSPPSPSPTPAPFISEICRTLPD